MHTSLRIPCLLLMSVATTAIAQTPSTSPSPPQSAMPEANKTARPAAVLSQSDALGVLSAVNQSEIAAGQLALQKIASGPVHAYAQKMVTEHGDNDQKLQAWSPNASAPLAVAQKEKGKQALARLQPLASGAFSSAYVAAMVKDHAAALDTLDHKLIPAAKDAQVRDFLTQTRAHVADHLAAAKRLQAANTGKGADAKGRKADHKGDADVPQPEGPTG